MAMPLAPQDQLQHSPLFVKGLFMGHQLTRHTITQEKKTYKHELFRSAELSFSHPFVQNWARFCKNWTQY